MLCFKHSFAFAFTAFSTSKANPVISLMMEADDRRHIISKNFFVKANNDANNAYLPRKGDIIVVGPMKSGTTWMQQILHQIRTKGDEDFDDIYKVTTWIPSPHAQRSSCDINREQVCNPRIFKHHEAYGNIYTTEEQKHVVIVRNPYDAALSWIKFFHRFFGGDEDLSDEESAKIVLNRNANNVEDTFNCIATWFAHRNDSNVLFLFYEDLIADLKTSIDKIAHFVEFPLTADELKRVTGFCTFEYMSAHKEKFRGETLVSLFAESAQIEKWKPKMGMVREDGGKVGEGEGNLGPKLKCAIDKLWKENLEDKFGFKTYADMLQEHGFIKH